MNLFKLFVPIILILVAGCNTDDLKIAEKICEKAPSETKISKCGNYFSSTPPSTLMDAPIIVYDIEVKSILDCGGNKYFTNEESRQNELKMCSEYLKNCRFIKTC